MLRIQYLWVLCLQQTQFLINPRHLRARCHGLKRGKRQRLVRLGSTERTDRCGDRASEPTVEDFLITLEDRALRGYGYG